MLAVRVFATWGEPLPYVSLRVTDGEDGDYVRANARGCTSVTVRPGRFLIEVGDSRTEVVAEAGRQTPVEIQPTAEGDVVFDPCSWIVSDRVQLVRSDGQATKALSLRGTNARQGFAYVAAGEYDVVRHHSPQMPGGTVLARVRVLAGRTNLVPLTMPTGQLTVDVEFEEAQGGSAAPVVLVRRILEGGEPGPLGQAYADRVAGDGRRYRFVLDGLWPGTYQIGSGSWDAARTVEVGTTPLEITLHPR